MRMAVVLLISAWCVSGVFGQASKDGKIGERYGFQPDAGDYPQKTPKDTLASVLKAVGNRRVNYLMAQLADPDYVDNRVKQVHGGRFASLVEEAAAKLANDPGALKRLRRYLEEGTWDAEGDAASAKIKDSAEQVFFRKIDGRWFFENRREAGKAESKDK